ncbi:MULTISPECIES: hypothetical protein [Halomonadaceae]|uniref:Uncharacterized protein n=1 Tax=Vreelandella malpeensis TaxID=1172368 RepID=A0ABS8DU17_9GAMM|nr:MULTISPECIES: hypothetical protein [Halomonas]MCB8889818.1 hypothetical protein [Halomonas malpeensis]MCP1314058.1 hypothetical protein [Halomonas sp. 707D7]MCP1325925.1 hypothetical protein [Halomonas sp. 707D4]
MERVYAWDVKRECVVYRIPGHTFDDGREDSDFNPVWLPAKADELPEGVSVDDLREVES